MNDGLFDFSDHCSQWFDRDSPDDEGDNELIGMPGIPTSVVDHCPKVGWLIINDFITKF